MFYFIDSLIEDSERCKLLFVQDNNGNTPLHDLCSLEYEYLKKLLPQPDLPKVFQIKNHKGESVLHTRSAYGGLLFTAYLLEDMDRTLIADALTTRDGKGDSIIHRELSFKNLDCMSESNETTDSFRKCEATDGLIPCLKLMGDQRHIAAKVLSEKNKEGMTALHMMAQSLPECISHILAQYINRCDRAHIVSILNNRGETPIHILCKEHHLVINRVLRCIPASQRSHLLSKQNFEGNTPLHLLAYHDDLITVEELLVMIEDQHYNFALRNKQEATALHIACALQNIGTLSAIVNCTGTVLSYCKVCVEE